MGRKANVSLQEQQCNLAKRQASLAQLVAKRQLADILKKNPHLHCELVRHANNLGYHADADSGKHNGECRILVPPTRKKHNENKTICDLTFEQTMQMILITCLYVLFTSLLRFGICYYLCASTHEIKIEK